MPVVTPGGRHNVTRTRLSFGVVLVYSAVGHIQAEDMKKTSEPTWRLLPCQVAYEVSVVTRPSVNFSQDTVMLSEITGGWLALRSVRLRQDVEALESTGDLGRLRLHP